MDINVDNPTFVNGEKSVAPQLERLLNIHGYSFQYSIAKRAAELEKEANWYFEGAEIPVETGSEVIHVDLVFYTVNRNPSDGYRHFLIGECKRADPALGDWCFAKTPYTWRGGDRVDTHIQFDRMVGDPIESRPFSDTISLHTDRPTANLAVEVKTGKKGDGIPSKEKSAINGAITQVLRSSSGYMNYLWQARVPPRELNIGRTNTFIPAIFTTANLFLTDVDISSANLTYGILPKGSVEVKEVDWLWFNYNRSARLKHNLSRDESKGIMYGVQYRDFTRTIAIVGPKGIDSFLKTHPEWMKVQE